MKCELCHKAEAATVCYCGKADGSTEMYVCEECARTAASKCKQQRGAEAEAEAKKGPPASFEMVLDAFFEVFQGALEQKITRCPNCGSQWCEYRKHSLLGCQECYTAFKDEVQRATRELHRATQHVGKVPQHARATWRLQNLEAALLQAVTEQRYEEAVALRDELRALKLELQQAGSADNG